MEEFLKKSIGIMFILVFVFCIGYSIGALTNAWGAETGEKWTEGQASDFANKAMEEIAERCKKEMLEIGGWTLVKGCIDLDVKALTNLAKAAKNSPEVAPFISRCIDQMRMALSWSLVESCVKMDLKAKQEFDAIRKG